MSDLAVIGLNHRTAPVAVRERVALPGDLAARLLRKVHAERRLEEALVLDTCNRTELYFVARPDLDALAHLLESIAEIKAAPPVADRSHFYRHDGLEAVRHLFRVAASLDSQIVGETQILGQVKRAYRLALEARTAGLFLNRLLHWAFRVGKRVQTETGLGRGSAGVAQAAVELASHIFSSLAGKTVLLVGAGENAECVARALVRSGAARLIVANRTLHRAQRLAADILARPSEKDEPGERASAEAPGADAAEDAPLVSAEQSGAASARGGAPAAPPDVPPDAPRTEAIGLDDLAGALAQADLVITSTGSPDLVLRYDDLAPTLERLGRALVILDIAVPRDVDERLGGLASVFLYNIDDLDRLVARNLQRRRREIPRAEAIVDYEVRAFDKWLASRQIVPTIRLLQEHFRRVRQDELAQHGREFGQADREQLDRYTEHLCNRLMRGPLRLLREAAEDGSLSETLALVEAIRRMFDLDALEADVPPDRAAPGDPS